MILAYCLLDLFDDLFVFDWWGFVLYPSALVGDEPPAVAGYQKCFWSSQAFAFAEIVAESVATVDSVFDVLG